MRKRLITCLAGAALGTYVAFNFNENLGLSPNVSMVVGSLAGAAIGYVFSTLLDVFASKPHSIALSSDAD